MRFLSVAVLAVLMPGPAIAQSESALLRAANLNKQVEEAYQGNVDGQLERLATEALSGVESAVGKNHEEYIRAGFNLGRVHFARKRYDAAETLLNQILPIADKVLHRTHPLTWEVADALAATQTYLGAWKKSPSICPVYRTLEYHQAPYLPSRGMPSEQEFKNLGKYVNELSNSFSLLFSCLTQIKGNNNAGAVEFSARQLLDFQLSMAKRAIPNALRSKTLKSRLEKVDRSKLSNELVRTSTEAYLVFDPQRAWSYIKSEMKPNQALVEIFKAREVKDPSTGKLWGPRYYTALVTFPDDKAIVNLGDAAEIDNVIELLLAAASSGMNDRVVTAQGRALYNRLLAPLEPLLKGQNELFLSPDGAIQKLPWALLMNPQGQWLPKTNWRIHPLGSILDLAYVAAASAPRQVDVVLGVETFSDESLVDLPSAPREAETIRGLLKAPQPSGTDPASWTGPRILHLSTHASPEGIHLPLAGKTKKFTPAALSEWDLRGTSLVTLSACQSGVGEVDMVNGLGALAAALTAAGSRTQLLSLWKVADEQTSDFMAEVYSNLSKGLSKSEALRLAQVKFIDSRSPLIHWAGWTMFGDPDGLAPHVLPDEK